MSAIKIRDNIYAVGALDPDVRMFHGYETPFGATYGCYLILDEKVVLVDNVKEKFTAQFFSNIEEIIPLEKIDILIQNHIEPDHSGSFPALIERCPNLSVYCTAGAQKGLKAYYGDVNYNCCVVKPGDTLSTGRYTWQFFPTPMVHWPDSMETFLTEEKILFSNDGFGQHICTGETFDDELGLDRLLERARDYYGNILFPFGNQIQATLKSLVPLAPEMICPSHGVILRSYIPEIVEAYQRWSQNNFDPNKAVIVYDTMWESTHLMAQALKAELEAQGKTVFMHFLRDEHYSQVMGDIVEAGLICVGSSTLNNQMLPTVAAFMTYLRGLRPQGRTGMAFGSYGWSGEATKYINEYFTALKWEILPERRQLYRG